MKKHISSVWEIIKHDWNKEAVGVIKELIQASGISQKIVAELLEIPLPTFNDKLSGKTPLKLNEIAMLSLFLNVESDKIIFGKENFVIEFHREHNQKLAENIREYLTTNKKYEVLGKLTATGFFKLF